MRKVLASSSLLGLLLACVTMPLTGTSSPVNAQAVQAAPLRAKAKDSFAKLDKWRIHYQDYGDGSEALVFVHGWSCNSTFWNENAPLLAGPRRVLTVDLIGHGLSDKPQTTYTMDLFAKSIEAALKDAGVKRAVLVGHSMGTPVVRQFYRNYPDQTIALVLVDGSLTSFGTPQQMAPLINAFKGPMYKQTVEQFVSNLTRKVASKAIADQITSAMLATPQNVIVGAMEAMIDPSIWKDDQIKVPVLGIYASAPQWTAKYFQYAHNLIPDLDEQVWDGVSHFLMMDAPQRFNAAVSAFLTNKKLLE